MIPTYCPECGSSDVRLYPAHDYYVDAECRHCPWKGKEHDLTDDPQTEPAETVDQ